MAQKVLVCGDVKGNFRQLFDKVEKLNCKKGPFDAMFCIGDFFGPSQSNWEPYKMGSLKVPILTYILGPNNESHVPYYGDANGSMLCPNLYHLGKRGILTSSGLKIAYVSGVEDSACEGVRITRKDVQAVRDVAYKGKELNEYLGIDVLLTSEWPRNVTNLIGDIDDRVKTASENGSRVVAWLVSQLKPRYHFVGLRDIYYERPPYRNHQPAGALNTHCTRFIALSSLSGKKWIYGAVLNPIDKMSKDELYLRTANETDCPYQNSTENTNASDQFFFDMSGRGTGKSPKKRKLNFSQDKCWFCLSGSQDLQTIISIGTEAYIAVPKGGLNRSHLIICPVKHLESYLHLSRAARREVSIIKEALTEYFAKSKEVPVFFERYYRTSHMQLNVVPVPRSRSENLRSAFQIQAKKNNLDVEELPPEAELGDVLRLGDPYTVMEMPNGTRLLVRCGQNFPMHFARLVLASKEVLNARGRVDWKDCVLSEEEEQELALQLRKDLGGLLNL